MKTKRTAQAAGSGHALTVFPAGSGATFKVTISEPLQFQYSLQDPEQLARSNRRKIPTGSPEGIPTDRHTQRRQWQQDLQRGKKQRFLIRSDADQGHEEAKARKKYGFFIAIRSASAFRTESAHQTREADLRGPKVAFSDL